MTQRMISIIMAFFTMITSLIGIIANRPKYEVPSYGFEEKSEGAIRVMSFNIRCTNVGKREQKDRVEDVVATIEKGAPDTLGVQEATAEWMQDLDRELEAYAHVGVGRDDGVSAGEHSAIFYLKDKYTCIDHGDFWLSPTPEVVSKGWDASHNRICTWAVLENKQTGERFVHLNAHFDNNGIEARSNSCDMILDKASQYADLPVVFTADMNIEEGSADYNHITSGCLRDAKYDAADTMSYLTYHDTKPQKHEKDIIDFVMINDNFNALTYRVITEDISGEYVSDHFPIYADIVIA